MKRLISILVFLDVKLHKCTHKQWTGIDGYWIAYGKIGRKRGGITMIYTGKKVYDPLTETYSTGYWVKDNQGNWYPVWNEAKENIKAKSEDKE